MKFPTHILTVPVVQVLQLVSPIILTKADPMPLSTSGMEDNISSHIPSSQRNHGSRFGATDGVLRSNGAIDWDSVDSFEQEIPTNAQEQEDVPPNGGYGWVCVACVHLINGHTWGLNSVSIVVLPSSSPSFHTLTLQWHFVRDYLFVCRACPLCKSTGTYLNVDI